MCGSSVPVDSCTRFEMVRLHIKRGDESLFLFDTTVAANVGAVTADILTVFNGRLKVTRICAELYELANHGAMLPPDIVGLTDEQVVELKLIDEWADKCEPSGGWIEQRDPIGRRNGRAPLGNMQTVLRDAVEVAKGLVDKKLVIENKPLTQKVVQEALDILRGAVMIVYPMQLPPHDPIRMEFSNTEDLSGTQASLEVIEPVMGQLWFAGHQMLVEKQLKDYVGVNEKTKVVVKLVKSGEGPPGREQVITEEVRKQLMLQAYRRQEEIKKLEQDNDDQYLDSAWADSNSLKRNAHGLDNLKFKFGGK